MPTSPRPQPSKFGSIRRSGKRNSTSVASVGPATRNSVSKLQNQLTDIDEEFSNPLWDSLTEYAVFTLTSDGAIATWNAGAVRTFGYDRSEILGQDFSLIFTPEEIASGLPALELRQATAEGRVNRDCLHVRKDGRRFWGTNTVQPIRDSNGKQLGFTKVVRDSTDRYEAAIALRQSEERFRLLVESVTDYAIFSTGPEGDITLWNSGAERTFGYTSAEIVGKSFSTLFVPEDVARGVPERELSQARRQGELEIEGSQLRKDGTHFTAIRRLTLLKAEHEGAVEGFAATAHDVTARRASERGMWDRAFHDSLTGLPNRALVMDHLQRLVARMKRHPIEQFALLYLDLKDFKAINDDFGHPEGDLVIKEAARRLLACGRAEDIVARLGGDEFTILLDPIETVSTAQGVAKRVHAALAVPFDVQGSDRVIGASIGIALGSPAYNSASDALRDADIAMYEAKASGDPEQTVVFDDSLRERGLSRHELESDIRHAIERNELFLKYQPIVTARDRRIVGFEALLRWRHPRRGLLSPIEFIPIAENTGAIVAIDRWVLGEACRQIRIWQSEFIHAQGLTISVNVSAKQFDHDDFPSYVGGVIAASGIIPQLLNIEITESVILEETDAVLAALAGIRALGVGIHVDDFGTGYSSLSYLANFPLSGVKVDRSFTASIDRGGDQAKIVRAIIALAHELGLIVVAEGIETAAESRTILAMSCELAQGYLFHPPLDVGDALELIASIGSP
jgi:diguanylate cyclase (GGDEF)-like protein/PAS domain S-box-containing protein